MNGTDFDTAVASVGGRVSRHRFDDGVTIIARLPGWTRSWTWYGYETIRYDLMLRDVRSLLTTPERVN